MSSLVDQVKSHGDAASDDADVELMRLVARRDEHAQQQLAERLVGRVNRLTSLLLDDPAEAEDAAQHALIEILQSAASFRRTGRLESWADRIAARTAVRFARRSRVRLSLFNQLLDPDNISDLFGVFRRHEATPRPLEAYLSRLPKKRREAFVLKYALGYTIDEIVEVTGAPRGTIKNRLLAARAQLRKMIKRDLLQVNWEGWRD